MILLHRKKTAQQKIEDYVVSGGHTEDLIPGDSCSALREISEEVRELPGYIGVYLKKKKQIQIVIASKDYC